MPRLDASIIIASHNGAASLPRCFAALEAQEPVNAKVEYILVDNASTDTTRSIMQEFTGSRGGKTLHEPRKGKSYALNQALQHARGDLLIFIDDDILPDAHWLKTYLDAFQTHTSVALMAGALRPDWPAEPADWQRHLAESGRSFGSTPAAKLAGPCTHQTVKGGNFAVRRSAIEGINFDENDSNLGHRRNAAGGQDTRFASEIARNGGALEFLPAASAKHIVSESEMSVRAISERYQRIGRGSAAQRNLAAVMVTAPLMLAIFALAAGLGAISGQKAFAAVQMTRAANRLGRLQFVMSRLLRKKAA